MSVPYQKLVAEIALRLNALLGTDPAALEVTYIKTLFAQTDFDSGDWTYTLAKDLVVLAEGKYAGVIAKGKDQSLRRPLHSVTSSIASGAVIPATDSGGEKVIGVYGSVRDADDNSVLTRKTSAQIRRFNAETWRTYPVYYFNIDGLRLEHTRENATIDVCVYNAATQRTSVEAQGDMLLHDSLEEGLVCEGVSMAFRDDYCPQQAQQYRSYSNAQLELISQGEFSVGV